MQTELISNRYLMHIANECYYYTKIIRRWKSQIISNSTFTKFKTGCAQ